MTKTIFVGVPIHDGKIYVECVAGMMQTQTAFPNRCQFDTLKGSFLPRNRDILTARFLDSAASHMLCLDSDIGFTPDNVNDLLNHDVEFVSVCYSKKQAVREIPAKLNGKTKDGLLGANHVPAGFVMLSRSCVERMVGAYRHLEYHSPQKLWALWSSIFDPNTTYSGEDVAFCDRWTAIGGEIWIDPGVILSHYGDSCYLPETDSNGLLKFSN